MVDPVSAECNQDVKEERKTTFSLSQELVVSARNQPGELAHLISLIEPSAFQDRLLSDIKDAGYFALDRLSFLAVNDSAALAALRDFSISQKIPGPLQEKAQILLAGINAPANSASSAASHSISKKAGIVQQLGKVGESFTGSRGGEKRICSPDPLRAVARHHGGPNIGSLPYSNT